MEAVSKAPINEGAVAELEQTMQLGATAAVQGLAKYRHTILFALTALIIISVAATVAATKVNSVIGRLAEKQLIELAEENTTRDALHIQSMITGGQGMSGMGMDSGDSMSMTSSDVGSSEKVPLTLDLLTGPTGLPMQFDYLVEGLGVLKSSLFAPSGEIVWSTDPSLIGEYRTDETKVQNAAAGIISSELAQNETFVREDGTTFKTDAVETYVPLRDSPTSPVVGILEFYREVGTDLDQLVDDTKSTVVWTTVATMGGLFFALLGFVIVSDRVIYRSTQRQLALVEGRQAERERAQKELGRAQQQIVASEKLAVIGQMSAGVAHDIRNPLGAIKNAAFMINKRLTADGAIEANPKLGRYLEIIEKQIGKSNEIITDLMTFARVASPTLTETHLAHVLEESLDTMTKNENVEISRHVDPDLPSVMADGDQLQRVFLNLANNAQEAMPEGGQLTITLNGVDNYVEIKFADTGEGISDENMGNVFEPLFTTKTKGTGLGLAVCREIILRHGGTISVRRNEAESGGTIFEVRLTAAGQQPQAEGETANDV